MPLQFDDHGNVVPYKIIELTMEEYSEAFVKEFPDSQTRGILYDKLVKYRYDLFRAIKSSFPQWVDGSFVTLKLNPNDIDLVNLIPFNATLDLSIENLIPYFTVGGSLENYQIDAHLIPVYPKTDPRFENTEVRMAYFKEWFGHDRTKNPKGFIELNAS